jgi:DNA polymerase (family 10)
LILNSQYNLSSIFMNNKEISDLLRNMAAAYEILHENKFRINAYIQASESINALQIQVMDMWKEGKLKDIPGVGGSLSSHLDELLRTGRSKHFEKTFKKIPEGTFELMKIRTIGPKTAVRLAIELKKIIYKGNTIYDKLENALKLKKVREMEGFGEKREEDIASSLIDFRKGQTKKNRMYLNEASLIATKMCTYLQQDNSVSKVDILGSLRRKKETIGDIDIAVVSTNSKKTIQNFISYSDTKTIVDTGEKGATILTNEGVQIDLRIAKNDTYGAMLQYFTGSKYHNIRLREYALSKGYSISEYGIKKLHSKSKQPLPFKTEESFYEYLGLSYIPPEMREDRGEIDLALHKRLPKPVEEDDIKGDLHIHTDFNLFSSHDLGTSSIKEIADEADNRKYSYIGFSDHNPKTKGLDREEIVDILKKRKDYFEHFIYSKEFVQKYKSIKKVFIMLEVDIRPDGRLALPDEGFEYVDGILVSIHSSFTQDKETMTKRILRGLSYHPKVRIFAHPTGRLINKRNGIDVYWDEIYQVCLKRQIALEINSSSERLDLPDQLVWDARKKGLKFVIGTDSHNALSLSDMKYGVSVARRGWATKHDILNTLTLDMFSKWLTGTEVNTR